MNAPAETTPANTDYLKVLEALVQINEPAERAHIARRADISPDGAGVQLVALAGKRIVVRCPQPKGAPALWSLAVSLSTVRQMVAGMKRAAAETGPAADDRSRIIAAMREIGAPASAFAIAKKSGVETSIVSVLLEMMTADGAVQRIGGTSGQRPKFALAPSVQSRMPTATDGTPGDGEPAPEPDDTQAVEAAEPTLMSDTAELQPSVEPVEPVAETPAAEADADGWIPWNGGECPVPVGSRCSIKIRDGRVTHCIRNPEAWWWGRVAERTTDPGDIVDYRPEPELPGVDDTEEALARRQIDLARELMADGCQPSEIDDPDDPDDYGDDEIPPAAAYAATVEAEAATDGEPGDDEPAPEPGDTQAEDRRRAVLEALREAPEANADSIASATGLSVSEARFFLHAMAADGIVERIEHENAGSIRRNPTIWRIVDADQPGDTQAVDAVEAAPVSDHAASLDDPDNFGDDEMPAAAPDPDGWIPWHGGECPVPEGVACWARIRDGSVVFADKPLNLAWGRCDILASPERRAVAPDEPLSPVWVRRNHPRDVVAYRLDKPAHLITPAYDALVEAEAAADEAPLAGEDVNGEADVLKDRCERYTDPVEAAAEQIAAAVADGQCPTVALLIQRASPVAEEAAQRAIDDAEVEALMREEEAEIALEMARDARARGRAVAEIIRFAEQRTGLAGDADPGAVLAAIVELLDGARSAVTGMSLPA